MPGQICFGNPTEFFSSVTVFFNPRVSRFLSFLLFEDFHHFDGDSKGQGNLTCCTSWGQCRRCGFDPWMGDIP